MSGSSVIEPMDYQPRDYQIELFDAALKDNIIACLGTGTGKTFIGVLLIKELSHQIRTSFAEGGKRTIFLVPTVPLVEQQKRVITEHTDLTVGGFYGDMGVDFWKKEDWEEHFSKNNVLVMVAEVFKNVLIHGFLPLSKINLIIFDECHRAVKNHPYREIMKLFGEPPHPRIMGLTASVLNGKCKASKLEDHILKLEQTLRSKALVASDVTSISRFGTKPTEMLYYYVPEDEQLFDSSTRDIELLLLTSQNQIDTAKEKSADFKLEPDIDNTDMFHPYRDCKQFISDIVEVLKTMGIWCAHQLVERYLNELAKTLEKSDNETVRTICNVVQGTLETVKMRMQKLIRNCSNPQDLVLKEISNKLQRLLALLACKNPLLSENRTLEPLCGIIFVEKRITAYILNLWFREVAKYRPYNFLKTDFVVGHGMIQTVDGNKQAFSSKKQHEVLELFRKKQINLLIASSVIEEGMDIPRCNFVIRYDPPNDYRSFIQSKGRARAPRSLYVIMLSNDQGKEKIFIEDLVNYKTIENILLKICKSREVPDELDSKKHLESDVFEPPYKPFDYDGSPVIPLTSAINVVNRYCGMLPGDSFTKCKPRTQFKEIPVEGSSTSHYKCEMKMPLNCVLKEWIAGKEMPNKTLAKMSAALEVCRLLHGHGELDDDHLLPKKQRLPPEEDDVMDTDDCPNNTKCYVKQISPIIYGHPPNVNSLCYVYMIHMTLEQIKPGSENAPASLNLDPKSSPHFYALITSNPLPKLCSFNVCNMAGKIKVDFIEDTNRFNLSAKGREILTKFQECTFTEVLKTYEDLVYFDINKPSYAFFIGAVVKDENSFNFKLDWKFMEKTNHQFEMNKSLNLKKLLRNSTQSTLEHRKFSENPYDDFKDAVVFPVHKNSNMQPMYIYSLSKETVKSLFVKDTYPTYEKYFAGEYGVHNLSPEYRMLECFYCDKPWLAVPQYLNRDMVVTSTRNKYDRRFLLPLEVCEIQGTCASMRKLATCLPITIHRLNSLLLARDLVVKVANETGIGRNLEKLHLDPVSFNWILQDKRKEKKIKEEQSKLYAYGELVNIDEDNENGEEVQSDTVLKYLGPYSIPHVALDSQSSDAPSLSLLLQAITALNASDFINLERLETVGDAFLKFAASNFAYYSYPKVDEGFLTALKMRQISNSKLCKLGKKLKLHEILTYSKVDMSTFLPPGFHVINGLEKAYAELKPEVRNLFLYGTIDQLKKLSDVELAAKLKEDNKTSEIKKDANGEAIPYVSVSLKTMQYLRDKNIADLVEALIGAYVITCGTKGTLLFMSWLGIEVLPTREPEEKKKMLRKGAAPIDASFSEFPPPQTALLNQSDYFRNRMEDLLSGFDELERKIDYCFKDKSYLLQAFTHTSYNGFHVTDCYQRLEFLGDAVLDHVITRHLYEFEENFEPGDLSDFRQALVNNTFFGMLAIKYDLHKYLKYAAPALLKVISNFADKVKTTKTKDLLEILPNMRGEVDCEVGEEIEVPKALGDIIESLAGAIYLDSGYSFNTVWKVFKKMMINEIENYRNRIPKNPVRQLMEAYPGGVEFKGCEVKGQKSVIKVVVNNKLFCGYGLNKKMAKNAAAKLALRKLQSKQNF